MNLKKVSLSTAIIEKNVQVEEIRGELVEDVSNVDAFLADDVIPVIVCESIPPISYTS